MKHPKGLRLLFLAHGVITLGATFVLAVAPGFIPSVVGIHLDPAANLIVYLLAGAEFGFAVLSFGASRLADPRALRWVVWSFIAFHGASGLLECYAYFAGSGMAILANAGARVLIIGLFLALS